MMLITTALWADERGFVVSAELVLVGTVVVLGMITGLACVRQAVVAELEDVAGAVGSLNQSYYYSGMHGCRKLCGFASYTVGSAFVDREDVAFFDTHEHADFIAPSDEGSDVEPIPAEAVEEELPRHPHGVPVPHDSPCPSAAPHSEAAPCPHTTPCPQATPCPGTNTPIPNEDPCSPCGTVPSEIPHPAPNCPPDCGAVG